MELGKSPTIDLVFMFQQLRLSRWYFMLAKHYKVGHHVKFAILIKTPQLTISMQLNEIGECFFLRIREWGIGRVGRNSEWEEHHF